MYKRPPRRCPESKEFFLNPDNPYFLFEGIQKEIQHKLFWNQFVEKTIPIPKYRIPWKANSCWRDAFFLTILGVPYTVFYEAAQQTIEAENQEIEFIEHKELYRAAMAVFRMMLRTVTGKQFYDITVADRLTNILQKEFPSDVDSKGYGDVAFLITNFLPYFLGFKHSIQRFSLQGSLIEIAKKQEYYTIASLATPNALRSSVFSLAIGPKSSVLTNYNLSKAFVATMELSTPLECVVFCQGRPFYLVSIIVGAFVHWKVFMIKSGEWYYVDTVSKKDEPIDFLEISVILLSEAHAIQQVAFCVFVEDIYPYLTTTICAGE